MNFKSRKYICQFIILQIILLFASACTTINDKTHNNVAIDSSISVKEKNLNVTFIKLGKLSITGDFDGDGFIDTIIENNISNKSKQSIDSIPFNCELDSLVDFLSKAKSDLQISLINRKCDILHSSNLASSLYCLINIGDNNGDKKDEVALVYDYCDFSNCNSCIIYTICNNRWIVLKTFRIHEDAFYSIDEANFNPNQIKGFLEHRGNKWFYIDYYNLFDAESDSDTALQILEIPTGCE